MARLNRLFCRRSWLKVAGVAASSALIPAVVRSTSPVPHRRLGVALVGLGSYANSKLRPALRETKLCRLAGVVTGSAKKGAAWAHHYDFSPNSVYHYDEMGRLADDPNIDIVYVVTPNALHAEHCIRAARAGKHVICEKPFTISVAEAEAVIAACDSAGVKLSLGYRLHFDPFHEVLRGMAVETDSGRFRKMNGALSFELRGNAWRATKTLAGGGPLMDLGIYVIQEACMAAGGVAPISVMARQLPKLRPDRFVDVEETLEWKMDFPGGERCLGRTSYNESANEFRAEGVDRWFELEPAFTSTDLHGATHLGPLNFSPVNQQARQMDAFARCILEDRASIVSGAMGRRDMVIIEAIYRSMKSKVPVAVIDA
jgi:glucose-fructose oxidoreductase